MSICCVTVRMAVRPAVRLVTMRCGTSRLAHHCGQAFGPKGEHQHECSKVKDAAHVRRGSKRDARLVVTIAGARFESIPGSQEDIFMRRMALAVAGLSLALAGSAAAQTTDQSRAHQHGAAAHMTDAQFVPMMLQHHQDGIEMAKIAEAKATNPQVKALATKIRQAQERESKELEQFRGTAAAGTAGHSDAHADAMMEMSKKSIARVRDANGAEVDRAFLEEMAKHHEMAIDMVHSTQFKNTRLKQSANKMETSQKREVQELKSTRQKLS
jgi:uncharacterized protein (DUF305 family)